ncbi:hypothetical protein GCM10029964_086140 [Kibdelosporangium lantanae]
MVEEASEMPYPVRLEGRPESQPSRWLWLVKWLLVVPHLVVLAFLWTTFALLTVFAFFAILITGRYPRGVFDFNVGVMRWTWRVVFYAYGMLGTDRYPPFTLADRPDYPARLSVAYPERLSRGLVLVKWWLLAIPHYIVIAFFLGGYGYVGTRFGLIAALVLIGAVVLLFTGTYPRSIQDFALGMNRWVARVGAYAALMTDEYPPFRLDTDPEESTPDEPGPPVSVGRVTATVAGVLVMLLGLVLAGAGGFAVWADQTHRDTDGYVTTSTRHFSTATYALRLDTATPGSLLGDIQIRTRSNRDTFVGIASTHDVSTYLGAGSHDWIMIGRPVWMAHQPMMSWRPTVPPGRLGIWVASAAGTGARELTWTVQPGQWTAVVLNADASPGVDVDVSAGVTAPGLLPWGLGLLGGGVLALAGGAWLQYLGLRGRPARPNGQLDPIDGDSA